MKKLLFLLLVSSQLFATNYYVKVGGNNGLSGTSDANAWGDLTKVNSFFSTLVAGDSILFKRGDTFYGTLTINKNGSIGNPIIVGAYGTGAKPIITGFTTITSGWTNEGGGIYSKIITSEAQTNMVTIDGVQYGMGRYPDASYLTYESFSTNTSITDNGLGTSTNWTNAEVVIRKNDWTLDRCGITNHTGDVLTYTSQGSSLNGTANYGYFIQNDLRTLTTYGEWYHNFSTGKFSMYFGAVDPNTKTVKVATLNNNIYSNGFDYIDIENIEANGAIGSGINYRFAHIGCNIKNNNVLFAGSYGIVILSVSSNNVISGNDVRYCNGVGINNGDGITCTIENNNIYSIGMIPGQANTNDGGIGINAYQSAGSSLVQYNTIRKTGYNGITMWRFGACTVQYNRIDSVCMVLDDGGGIYTSGAMTRWPRIIRGNIISNVIGGSEGTPSPLPFCAGIYLDEVAQNVQVIGNTVFDIGYSGIKLHKANTDTITDNTVYNCLRAFSTEDYVGNQVRNNSLRRNTFVAKTSGQFVWHSRTVTEDANLFGVMDSNYYARPIDDNLTFSNQPASGLVTRTLAQWKTFTSQDANSKKSPKSISNVSELDFQYNTTSSPITYNFTGQSKIGVDSTVYNNSVTIPAWGSMVLIANGNTVNIRTFFIKKRR